MNLKITRPESEQKFIDELLPKVPLTESILIPTLLKCAKKPMLEMIKQEIEIYKKYPKNGKMDVKTFDTRNHKTCFMGQGFRVTNSEWGDADLAEYRKAIGTIHHGTWGNCTLLEAWAGDHYYEYTSMVKGVFSYTRGDRDTLPTIKIHILPIFSNKRSGRWQLDDDDKVKYEHQWLTALNGEMTTQAAYSGMKAWKAYDSVDDPRGTFGKGDQKRTLRMEFERDWERKKRGF